MQCNDYFYSRYFGSPFTLSGMTPHWPTDYLCGCCHTWLLQLGSLSTITPSESSLFYYWTFICFSLYHCKSLPIFQRLNFYFLWSFPLLQRLHHLLISFSHQSLYWFSSTFSNFSFLLAWKYLKVSANQSSEVNELIITTILTFIILMAIQSRQYETITKYMVLME